MPKKILISAAIIFTSLTLGMGQSLYLNEIGSKDSLFSYTLEEQRDFWVQVPENFDPESAQKYPVVYVLDGGVHLKAVSTVHSYYWGGHMPEMILVGISNSRHRSRDLTTSKIGARQGAAFTQESGGAEDFTRFIAEELIPHIEATYPVSSYRTLIGHSYAGLFTIHMLMKHSDLFENYMAIDPSLDWDNQKLLKHSKELLSTKDFSGKSLFISLSGQLHMQNSDITLENVMQDTTDYTLFARSIIEFTSAAQENEKSGLNLQWKFYENDFHGTVSLPSILDGLVYLFNWYPIENTDRFNSPETPLVELMQIIRNRENKLKNHFGYFVPPFEEGLLNMLGYMNLEWGQTQKSLAFFELCLEYFPESANAYDSLADYYEAQGDYANALSHVTKAHQLSGSDYHGNRMKELQEKNNNKPL